MTTSDNFLRPFWRYYGGKWRAAPRYPAPEFDTLIEPFAGAAGYSLRYPDRNVVLIEKYEVIHGIWKWLIRVSAEEVLAIPEVDSTDDLPGWVHPAARCLVGFCLNDATTSPSKTLSAGKKRNRANGKKTEGWSAERRTRVAEQVGRIRHWDIRLGDYTTAPRTRATYFVDPPYSGSAGRCYIHDDVDFAALSGWCRRQRGQIIVCENAGADWLPFRPFATFRPSLVNKAGSEEVIWTGGGGLEPALADNADARERFDAALGRGDDDI